MEQQDQEELARTLIRSLSSVSDQTRLSSLIQIRHLTKTDPTTRPMFASMGAIPYLADTLYSPAPLPQENAASALLNISLSTTIPPSIPLLDALSHALSHHTRHHPSAVSSSAATLFSLASRSGECRSVIGSRRDIVYALVDIVRDSRDGGGRVVQDALRALFGIALEVGNRRTMVEMGAVEAGVGVVVRDGRVGVVEDATAVIARVAGCEEGPGEFRRVGGVRVLVDLVDGATGSSWRVRENAVYGLLNLVEFGGVEVLEEVKDVGLEVVVEGLRDVVECGSEKGCRRAKELLRYIEEGWSDEGGCVTVQPNFTHNTTQ